MHLIGPIRRHKKHLDVKEGDLIAKKVCGKEKFYIVLKTGWTPSGIDQKIWVYSINSGEYKTYNGGKLKTFWKVE